MICCFTLSDGGVSVPSIFDFSRKFPPYGAPGLQSAAGTGYIQGMYVIDYIMSYHHAYLVQAGSD